jgi:hypothetical protein
VDAVATGADYPPIPVGERAFIGYIFLGAAAAASLSGRDLFWGAVSGAQVWGLVVKVIFALAGLMAVGVVIGSGAACAGDDFPLAGNYTQNVPCKGDGSDPHDVQVKISPQQIDSQVGVCTFLDTKRDGSSVSAHVECEFPGGPLIGDVTFTVRPDKTVELVDRDKNYDAVLYRCP